MLLYIRQDLLPRKRQKRQISGPCRCSAEERFSAGRAKRRGEVLGPPSGNDEVILEKRTSELAGIQEGRRHSCREGGGNLRGVFRITQIKICSRRRHPKVP